MNIEIVGDPGLQWTDTPRGLTIGEAAALLKMSRLDAIKAHRVMTGSTLAAAVAAVDTLRALEPIFDIPSKCDGCSDLRLATEYLREAP